MTILWTLAVCWQLTSGHSECLVVDSLTSQAECVRIHSTISASIPAYGHCYRAEGDRREQRT